MLRPAPPHYGGVKPKQPDTESDFAFIRASLIGLSGLGLCLCLAMATVMAAGGLATQSVRAANPPLAGSVAYVVDASARMQNPDEGSNNNSRLWVVENELAEVVRGGEPATTMSLTAFGNGGFEDCQATAPLVLPATDIRSEVAHQLGKLSLGTSGRAPLAETMAEAILSLAQSPQPRTLVTITGGADTCSAEAGMRIAGAAAQAGGEVRILVIGFKVSAADASALQKMLAEVPNTQFLPAPQAVALQHILVSIQAQLNQTGPMTIPTTSAGQ